MGGAPRLVRALERGSRVDASVRQVVHRRQAERLVQLSGPARAGGSFRAERPHLGRRARRRAVLYVRGAARGGLYVRERAQGARGREGRPCDHLPAHDSRGRGRHARLRADRCGPFGRLRRVQPRLARGPQQRRGGEGPHHRRRRVAPGRHRAAQGERRRGDGALANDRARGRGRAGRGAQRAGRAQHGRRP